MAYKIFLIIYYAPFSWLCVYERLCICRKLIFLYSTTLASLKVPDYKFNQVYVDLFMTEFSFKIKMDVCS